MTSISFIFLSLLLLRLITVTVESQPYTKNLTKNGVTLSPSGPYSYMASPTGEFAFGFLPLAADSSLFLLAIWFNKTSSTQPIIWFAKNSSDAAGPVLSPAGSKLRLTDTGELILASPTSQTIWNPGTRGATHVALVDHGDLLIYDDTELPLWQSFDFHTDTIVPGQSLGKVKFLQSKLTDSDFSPGRFKLEANKNGYLAFFLVVEPPDPTNEFYWSSNNKTGRHLVFNLSGLLYYELENNSSPFYISDYPFERYHQHATLDPDGVFRVYIYDKYLSDKGSWSVVRELPENACGTQVDVGSGMCGFNAYCIQSSNLEPPRLSCMCPQEYTFIDANRPYLGCRPNFALQNCSVDESTDFKFVEMKNTDWFGAGDYMHFVTSDESGCRTSCLIDCFCLVVIYRASNCWKKKLPLSNGRQGTYVGGKALVKVRISSGTSITNSSVGSFTNKNQSNLVIAGAIMLGISLLILISISIASLYLRRRKRDLESEQVDLSPMGMNMKNFSYKDLHDATKGFTEEVGRGSFGIVYKGILKLANHSVVIAVKKLDRLLKDGDREFANEVQSIGQIHHKNLVRLFGFCREGPHRILVYEYMSNGSLTNFISEATKLGWNRRAQIAIGVAQGLYYLHEGCCSQIIHCDIKPQNILLDDNLVPRISDFGLAKLIGVDQTRATTYNIRGTIGYFAPEWFKNTGITPKMDVYSFGVMLFEIVCCRSNIMQVDEEEIVLRYWAYDCFREGRINLLIQGDKEAEADIEGVERFLKVAIWCIQENPVIRPTMHKVTQMLEGAATIAPPPDPSIYISK
ncbi:Serine/threonine-protein kinase [Rhynchospora pubera]|uniref:Receptor-like serine/threonine-protein kinase n=1 Tax=Rhynchospora pubera TaxID=906938 RepID=A0AAV8CSP1_9POAL|nr:Serine/threonine-protein kinase [Rhynchospora pubera]